MAKLAFKTGEDFMLKLARLSSQGDEIAKRAVYAAGGVVIEEVRGGIRKIPKDKYRMLKKGEKFAGISGTQREDLLTALGTTPIMTDQNGVINVKVGFDGYGSKPTKKYPKGVPNQLLACSIESGSSVRVKYAFVRPAISASRKKALAAMDKEVDEAIKKTMDSEV